MAQSRSFLSFVVSKCENLLIMSFDMLVTENLWGRFLPKIADYTAISVQTISILELN